MAGLALSFGVAACGDEGDDGDGEATATSVAAATTEPAASEPAAEAASEPAEAESSAAEESAPETTAAEEASATTEAEAGQDGWADASNPLLGPMPTDEVTLTVWTPRTSRPTPPVSRRGTRSTATSWRSTRT